MKSKQQKINLVLSIHEIETLLANAKKITASKPNTFQGRNIATVILMGDAKPSLIPGELSLNSEHLMMTTPYSAPEVNACQ